MGPDGESFASDSWGPQAMGLEAFEGRVRPSRPDDALASGPARTAGHSREVSADRVNQSPQANEFFSSRLSTRKIVNGLDRLISDRLSGINRALYWETRPCAVPALCSSLGHGSCCPAQPRW